MTLHLSFVQISTYTSLRLTEYITKSTKLRKIKKINHHLSSVSDSKRITRSSLVQISTYTSPRLRNNRKTKYIKKGPVDHADSACWGSRGHERRKAVETASEAPTPERSQGCLRLALWDYIICRIFCPSIYITLCISPSTSHGTPKSRKRRPKIIAPRHPFRTLSSNTFISCPIYP